MKSIYALLLLVPICFPLKSQEKKKALVTEVNFVRRSGTHVNSETFPFYFHHKEFIRDVQGDISMYLKKNFGATEVEFLYPDSIYYQESLFTPPISARELAKAKSSIADIYASIETVLLESSDIGGIINYSFNTRVWVYNAKGKKLLKFRNKIPFVVTIDESITGDVEMSEIDFYTFYLDGLEYAFTGELPVVNKRYIIKPPTDYYAAFMSDANKIYVKRLKKTYYAGANVDSLKPVYSFNEKPLEFQGIRLEYRDYIIHDRYIAQNELSSETLEMRLHPDKDLIQKIIADTSGIKIEVFKSEVKVGEMASMSRSVIAGNIKGIDYRLKGNQEYFVSEVYIKDDLKFLINELEDKRVVFYHNSASKKELYYLLDVIFILDYLQALTY